MLSEDIIRADGTVGPVGQRFEDALPAQSGSGGTPVFTPKSSGGDLWMAGVDFDMGPNFTSDAGQPVCAYIASGRVYWQGLAQRGIGTENYIIDTLPAELQPNDAFTADAYRCVVAAEFGPGYDDVLITALTYNQSLIFYQPLSAPDQDATIWLNGISYMAPNPA